MITKQEKELSPKLKSSQTAVSKAQTQVDNLSSVVNVEEDKVFASFCSSIGVSNIREYEEGQLKLMQQQIDSTLEFDTQLKRIKHQLSFVGEEIKDIESRIQNNERRVEKENEKIRIAKEEQAELEKTIQNLEVEIETLKEKLGELNGESETKRTGLDDAKRSFNKASKNLEGCLKIIANSNDEIERLGAERSGIYRRCRLEEIDLPLESGSLNKVPLEEVGSEETSKGWVRSQMTDNLSLSSFPRILTSHLWTSMTMKLKELSKSRIMVSRSTSQTWMTKRRM